MCPPRRASTVPRHAQAAISAPEYRALAELRYHVRHFLRFSEEAARETGLEPQQHQLLLAVKGLPAGLQPTIRELAGRLQIQHHSAVELINRSERNGLIRRSPSASDRRVVLIELTSRGERLLRDLSLYHREALQTFGPLLASAIGELTSGKPISAKFPATRPKGQSRK